MKLTRKKISAINELSDDLHDLKHLLGFRVLQIGPIGVGNMPGCHRFNTLTLPIFKKAMEDSIVAIKEELNRLGVEIEEENDDK